MVEAEIKKRKTIPLKLTRFELLHLRDMLSILLAAEMKQTISQALAQKQQRTLVEAKLWQKVSKACDVAGIPLEEDAPDYVVATASSPSIGVFELLHDGPEVIEVEQSVPNIFETLVNK